MSNHRYSLQKYKSLADRYSCPRCLEKKKFTRYIDNQTGEQLHNDCGRCERSDSCGYHCTPRDFFKENPDNKSKDFQKWVNVPAPPKREPSFIDKSVFKQDLGFNSNNTFHSFLLILFGKEQAENLINRYHIGSTRNNKVIFYQLDLEGNVRTGNVMKYNLTNSQETFLGKNCNRDKKINPTWVHSKLNLPDFNLKQCLFGEHLLSEDKICCIVESAKTAIIASVYYPQFTWLSCEGKNNLSIDKLKVLKGKQVILFPDLNGFEKWSEKAKEMTFCKSVEVDTLLEEIATDDERLKGLDLADYLLRQPPPTGIESKEPVIQSYLERVKISEEPIKLSQNQAQDLVTYFLTNTKFLAYGKFIIDGIEIDSLPFDVGFHLGVLACPTNEQVNEALQFVQDNQYLFDTEMNGRTAFKVGYNFGIVNSNQDKKHSIDILTLIKAQLM
jgi:hypothetical protein